MEGVMRSKLVNHLFTKKNKKKGNSLKKDLDNKHVLEKQKYTQKGGIDWHNEYRKQVLKQTLNNKQAMLRQYYAEKYDTSIIKSKTILYEVRDGTSFTDSPRSLFNYMIEDEKYKDFKHFIVYDQNHLDSFPLSYLKTFSNVELVERVLLS